ncbi:MAG: hypothetical protein ACRDYA_23115, partial [Egibacteraceae bacterium]
IPPRSATQLPPTRTPPPWPSTTRRAGAEAPLVVRRGSVGSRRLILAAAVDEALRRWQPGQKRR